MHLAHRLVQGVDLWLNVPRVPLEACGTSGMKAALNARAPAQHAGRVVGRGLYGSERLGHSRRLSRARMRTAVDAARLYDLLEQQVVPMYYQRDARGLPVEWLQRMKHALKTAGERFNARRMVQDYVTSYYAPAMRGEAPPQCPTALRARSTGEHGLVGRRPRHDRGRRRSGVVHLAAEYGWLARTGGLAEAVAGLAASPGAHGDPGRRDHPPAPLGAEQRPGARAGGRPTSGAGRTPHRGGAALPHPRGARASPGCTASSIPTSIGPGLYGEVGDGLRRQPAALGILLPRRAGDPAPGHPHALRAALPRLAHGARAGLPADLPQRPDVRAGNPHRAHGAQRRVPGTFPGRRHARDRAAVGAVHLAVHGVARQAQPAQGRAQVRRRGDDREPDARARAAHPGRRLRAARRLSLAGGPLHRHRQRDRHEGVGPGHRSAHHLQLLGRRPDAARRAARRHCSGASACRSGAGFRCSP